MPDDPVEIKILRAIEWVKNLTCKPFGDTVVMAMVDAQRLHDEHVNNILNQFPDSGIQRMELHVGQVGHVWGVRCRLEDLPAGTWRIEDA